MRLRDQYDWIVLGDSPGALLSAGLVAKLGLSVLVLSFLPSAKSVVSKSGQVFDPESNYLLGLGPIGDVEGLLMKCLDRIGILPAEAALFRKAWGMPQILTAHQRTRLLADPAEFAREMAREWGKDFLGAQRLSDGLRISQPRVSKFWSEVPDRLTIIPTQRGSLRTPPTPLRTLAGLKSGESNPWLQTRSAANRILSESEDFREWRRGAVYAISGHLLRERVPADTMAQISGAGGCGGVQGGLSAYRELLKRLAVRAGVHHPEKSECRRIFVDGGRLVGVQLANRGNVIGTSGALMGCALAQARDHVSVSGREWPHRLRKSPTAVGWRMTIALTVSAEAIPPGMESRSIWQEAGAPPLELEMGDPSDFGVSGEGLRLLFLRTPVPFVPASLEPEFQRLIAARAFRQLSEIFPFVEYHVRRIFPDFRKSENTEFKEAFPYSVLSMVPENLRVFAGDGLGSRSGIEGLFISSSEAYPQYGSYGETLAALEATAWIAHKMGLPGPLA